ncbi:hypothetical protein E3U55_11270 [Filobacillus milosensis]|uniref:Uncharacterized protein n=1 Tax=Filobacillus milosensis TaxID=94137 RepID=A0A4Y8IMK5_9BACI|nr:DUF5693 family protein [Filobacillus milosensis]TFB19284.1 hypothetical protein E3U55_11270 [Filobacillus milosensis]
MSKRLVLWGIVVLLLLASLPGIYTRWQVEESNTTYETVLPYFELAELTEESGLTMEDALQELKDAGLTTISVEPLSLESMDEKDKIDIYSPTDLKESLRFSPYDYPFSDDLEGIFISVPNEEYYANIIEEHFVTDRVMIGDERLLYLSMDKELALDTVLGYDREVIEEIQSYGFEYIVRAENTNQYGNETTVEALLDMKNENLNGILFSGQEAIGYPELAAVRSYSKALNDAGYHFYSIEFTGQKGNTLIARETNYDHVRLHSLSLEVMELQENVDRAVRAVKERNMRSLFLHVPETEPNESLDATVLFLEQLEQQMPAKFETGPAKPFQDYQVPVWSMIAALAEGIMFIYIASEIVPVRLARLGVTAVMALLALAYLATDKLLFAQVFALGIAVAAPSYAVVKTSEHGMASVAQVIKQYLLAALYTFVGIIIVVAVLNGKGFITGFEMFRGVKLVYVLPIAFVAGYFFWQIALRMLNMDIKYWHALVMVFIGGAGVYYVLRTGNTSSVSSIEMTARHLLEEYLYVRPRTKEFLLGFPAFVFGLYVMGISKLWGRLFMIPGVIGFLSIVNTFTHYHIPLEISMLRTAYGLLFGLIIGLIAVVVFGFIFKRAYKYIPERWIR